VVALLAACERERAQPPRAEVSDTTATIAPARSDDALTVTAQKIIAFLRGEAGFDASLFADTVTLQIAPEAGGATRRIANAQLQDRNNWSVDHWSLVPPKGSAKLTTKVGTHFRCQERSLDSVSHELAKLPHVGTKLEPDGADSCLQVWNLTLVFEGDTKTPRLVAAVYDQFEW
jgi:hypothetical protein